MPTLQSAYSNRTTDRVSDTTQKEEQKIQQQTNTTSGQIECPIPWLLQCPHTYRRQSSPEHSRPPTQLANHQQIKQHHNHQSTTHPPHHHRHQQSISSSRHSRLDNNNYQQESNIERVRDSVKDHLIHQRNHHQWQTNLPLFRCGSVRSMHRVPSQPLDPRQQTTHTRTKSRGLQTTPRQFTHEELGDGTEE